MVKKIVYLYLCTTLVCFTFASIYTYLEETNTDEIFDDRPMIEKQMYIKYFADELSFNPYDSYTSRLENYILTLCWIMGCWNLMDVFLLVGIKNDLRGKPEEHLLWNVLNNKTYKYYVRKLKKRKSKCRKRKSIKEK